MDIPPGEFLGIVNAEFGRRWKKKRARRKDRSGEDGKM